MVIELEPYEHTNMTFIHLLASAGWSAGEAAAAGSCEKNVELEWYDGVKHLIQSKMKVLPSEEPVLMS